MLECVCALRVPRRGAGFLHMLSSCLRRLALTICMCREPAMGGRRVGEVHGALDGSCGPFGGSRDKLHPGLLVGLLMASANR